MPKVNLKIDTNFGLSEIDIINTNNLELKTRIKLLDNIDNHIKKRYQARIK